MRLIPAAANTSLLPAPRPGTPKLRVRHKNGTKTLESTSHIYELNHVVDRVPLVGRAQRAVFQVRTQRLLHLLHHHSPASRKRRRRAAKKVRFSHARHNVVVAEVPERKIKLKPKSVRMLDKVSSDVRSDVAHRKHAVQQLPCAQFVRESVL